jgi:hypothetical protein
VTGCGLDGGGSIPFSGKRFLYSAASRPALGLTNAPIQEVPGTSSLGIKQAGREADYVPPSSTVVKNDGAITPLPIRLQGILLNYLGTRTHVPFYEFSNNRKTMGLAFLRLFSIIFPRECRKTKLIMLDSIRDLP